ncbi:hypothetical protein LCM10_05535 [Rossellomorea aquimaris]|uniref:hypothetical protein n=1 Tax=Rossellomorea aquimaris TaxID=189382 RepID=UPI001CD3FB6E|nr:hypothetical protein [Rossellomorea aquimaris]MCA1054440.1 hypothetical protein [Rossellomorea aquimaris]
MGKVKIKVLVLCSLLVGFVCLLFYKEATKVRIEKWMTIEEKYYPQADDGTATGIKTKEKIKGEGCAIKFNSKKPVVYDVDCDRYTDYLVGERVKVTVQGEQLIKIRRK